MVNMRVFNGSGVRGSVAYVNAMNCGGLVAAYGGLSRARKRYVHDLVGKFGWGVRLAIQHAYAFPFDSCVFDYRNGLVCYVNVNRRTGAITSVACEVWR